MPAIKSQLNPRSEEFRANAERMRALVEDLKQKAAVVSAGGDEAARKKHTSRGKLLVRGTTTDNGTVTKVLVNGQETHARTPNFAEWEVVLTGLPAGSVKLEAHAEDAAGNVEKRPHILTVTNAR